MLQLQQSTRRSGAERGGSAGGYFPRYATEISRHMINERKNAFILLSASVERISQGGSPADLARDIEQHQQSSRLA